MEREIIKLNNDDWRNLVYENYITMNNSEEIIKFDEIDNVYDDSGRHTEYHHKILKRNSDGKFFRIDYETSVKDSMGWNECNYGETTLSEVFPETVTKVIYK